MIDVVRMNDRSQLDVCVATLPAILEMPRSWQGLGIEWDSAYRPVPVFLGGLEGFHNRKICLFGIRYEMKHARLNGKKLPEGFFIEYLVVEVGDGVSASYLLRQERTVTYSSHPEKNDYVLAGEMKRPGHSLSESPRWNAEDAQWPLCGGVPMTFIGQFRLIKNDITERFLSWDKHVFLFCYEKDEGRAYKITTQDCDAQTAEDYYRDA